MTVAQKLEPSDPVTENLNDRGKAINAMESKEKRKESCCFILISLLKMEMDSTWTLPSTCLPFAFS